MAAEAASTGVGLTSVEVGSASCWDGESTAEVPGDVDGAVLGAPTVFGEDADSIGVGATVDTRAEGDVVDVAGLTVGDTADELGVADRDVELVGLGVGG